MPPYPAYRPSAVPWLGDVPEHWEVKRLKLVTTTNDDTLSEGEDPLRPISYVDIGSVDSAQGIVEMEEMVFEDAPSRARRLVQEGDTIVSTVRTYLRAIAPVSSPSPDMVVSTGFAVVRPVHVDPGFSSWALREPGFIEEIVARSVGVSYPAINASEIGELPIPLPPVGEQRAIAAFLDRETGRIDALVERKRRLIERLREYRAALITRAVTRGLPPEAALAAGLDPSPRLRPSGVEWLGEAPAHWEVARLKDVGRLIAGSAFPEALQGVEGAELPFFKVGDLAKSRDGRWLEDSEHTVSYEIAAEIRARVIPQESVVYAKIGAALLLNRRCVTARPSCIDNNMTAYVPDRDQITTDWALYTLSLLDFGEHVNPGAVPSLSEGDQAILPLPVPPLDEQRAIAAYLDAETERLDTLMARVETAIERLREHRTALITAAVTGQVDVRGAPPAGTLSEE